MSEKKAIIFSVIAIIISAGHLIYYFWLSEKGPIGAKPQYYVALSDSIRIENHFEGITFSPFINIYNTGNKAGNISKISSILFLKNVFNKTLVASSFVLPGNNIRLDPAPFSIEAGKAWSARVHFSLSPREKDMREKSELDFRVANNLQSQYLDVKSNNIPYLIPDDLHIEVKSIMEKNVEWLEEGEYTLSILLWEDPRSSEPSWSKNFKFRLSKEMIRGVKEYQIKAYKVPPKYPNNLYMRFVMTPPLSEVQ